jgi:hypothetical protein
MASGATVTFQNVANSSFGQPVPAGSFEAIITTSAGEVDVELENFLANPTGDVQLISGITFTLSSADPGSATLTQPGTGSLITLDKKTGVSTHDTTDTLNQWLLTTPTGTTTTTLDLTAIGSGSPTDIVIGPPGSGNLASGLYPNANASISSHNPLVYETLQYQIHLANVVTGTTVSNVIFNVGTIVNSINSTQVQNVVPEPSSFLFMLLAIPVGVYVHRKRN